MPVTAPNQPSVQVTLPVPTPVTPKPKPAPQPRQQPVPQGGTAPALPQPPQMPVQAPAPSAFVFPWQPARKVPRQPVAMARKRDTDPRAREQEFRSWIESVKPKWVKTGWSPDRGEIFEHISDDAARMAFADWLREVTGNESDPRATVVQKHTDNPKWPTNSTYMYDLLGWGSHPAPVYETKKGKGDGLRAEIVTSDVDEVKKRFVNPGPKGTHAIVTWNVTLPPWRDSTGRAKPGRRAEKHTFHALMNPEQFHGLIDNLPEPHRQAWRDYANRYGLTDPRAKQMARPRRYSSPHAAENGRLTPEQEIIAQRAISTGDPTGWRILGDNLQENGFPNTGEVISRAAEGEPGSTADVYDIGKTNPTAYASYGHGDFNHALGWGTKGPLRAVNVRLGNKVHIFRIAVPDPYKTSRRLPKRVLRTSRRANATACRQIENNKET